MRTRQRLIVNDIYNMCGNVCSACGTPGLSALKQTRCILATFLAKLRVSYNTVKMDVHIVDPRKQKMEQYFELNFKK